MRIPLQRHFDREAGEGARQRQPIGIEARGDESLAGLDGALDARVEMKMAIWVL